MSGERERKKMNQMLTARGWIFQQALCDIDVWADGDKLVYVSTTIWPKLTIGILKEFLIRLQTFDGNHGILQYRIDVTTQVKEFIKSRSHVPIVETFCVDELTLDIVNYCLQPRFTLLANHDAYKYGKSALPKLLHSDPIARYYNWPIGSVIKIESEHMSTLYRLVVP